MTKKEKALKRVEKQKAIFEAINRGLNRAKENQFTKNWDISYHILVELELAGYHITKKKS